MLSYYVIYCEKFRKVLQRTEKVSLSYLQNLYGMRMQMTGSKLHYLPVMPQKSISQYISTDFEDNSVGVDRAVSDINTSLDSISKDVIKKMSEQKTYFKMFYV